MNEVNKRNIEFWNQFYEKEHGNGFVESHWLDMFNEIIAGVRGPVVDLGCGNGYDTAYLLDKNKKVIACDGSINAVFNVKNNYPSVSSAMCFDMLDGFPLSNNMTNLIIADLCLHYFTKEDTIGILKEMRRILVNKGHILLRVNSINDENYGVGQGTEVEPHLYLTEDGRYKRFFASSDIYDMFNLFDIKYVREAMMNRYKLTKKLYVVDLKNCK